MGFSQSEPDSAAFRAAETKSIKDAAKAAGATAVVTNANSELPKQISDIQELINQKVDILVVAPVNSDGLTPALEAAHKAKIPVVTIDRKVTDTFCKDYVSFLGSDFKVQGQRAADALAKQTNSKANVAVLLGPSGNNVTDGRRDGFVNQVKAKYPNIKIVAQQTANASRDEGQKVTAQLLQTHPEINAAYAFNDESGLGAMAAIQEAGKKPGTDVKIVSIDGTRNAVQAIVDGKYNGVIESNPRFGDLVFETLKQFYDGKPIAENIIIKDGEYTPENAKSTLGQAF
ncbi:ABC transporter substrate-binding protein [Acidipropionibacterium acidipropionici]|uniref:ABC transporter substrate-binding protein n=1 Tax=Acidipropionibacterium acidipropionici TaxID=1748 RepID=UPI002FC86874